ncbi:hypothetical protein [Roseateles toxinivorans]|uniref:Uncharacterized protein n=1 Tax=Roseateles toxinivorans TaxID=270368 RepID=A0A4R6QGD9_9BURK|nr:hypothetical protein [Roseateles toxinivorans]TDP61481.1 hypothetical protein DES47_11230 [Roseateles toxinivorans]
MRVADVRSLPAPLQLYRQEVQQRFVQGSPPPVQLDTTALASSPIRERNAAAAQDLLNGVKPAGASAASVKLMLTPAYSRNQVQIVDEPGLRIRVELGPMMWNQISRGDSLGHFVDTFA